MSNQTIAEPQSSCTVRLRPDRGETRSHSADDDLLATILRLSSDNDMAAGFYELACHMREAIDCHVVFLGVRNKWGNECHLQSISDTPCIRRHTVLATCAEEVLSEALLQDAIKYHDTSKPLQVTTDAQKNLSQLYQGRNVTSGPIRDRNKRVIGAWAILHGENDILHSNGRQKSGSDEITSRIGIYVELMQRIRPHALRRLAGLFTSNASRRFRGVIWLIACALACLLALPLPYHVKCDCKVQAADRRFVPVPYDGVLKEVLVEPGEFVETEQVLAYMDAREIELEVAAKRAEYNRAKKRHDVQLAARNTSASQVAKLDMQRLKLQIELLQHRLANLEIRSPVEGIVIGGDPKKKERARLAMGVNLLEIGPLDKMVAEVLVPDEDIAHVAEGQNVRIRLDAYSSSSRDGTIRRVSPQAQTRDHANVFVAEVELDNPDRALRPGMMGRCRIRTIVRPLIWNLFHGAWDRMVFHLAW